MRSALFLLAAALAVMALNIALRAVGGSWPAGLKLWIQAALCFLAFGVTTWLGLKVLDGDQTKMLRLRVLNPAHVLFLSLAGALAVCPVSLLADITEGLLRPFVSLAQPQTDPLAMAQFLPMLVGSVIIAPVCEELFFRGYLFGVMEREGETAAVWSTALMFMLIHGLSAAAPGYVLLGALLALLMLRTGSILAPMLVHAAYNFTILVIGFMGLDGLFYGLTTVSCAVCLLGSAAFVWALKHVYAARCARADMRLEMPAFSKGEWAALIGVATAVIAAGVLK